jgi:hypothetical protein
MSVELPDWPRSQFQPGGAEAYLFFAVYGEFSTEVEVSRVKYRTSGIPRGINVRRLDREKNPDFPFSTGPIGELLQPKQPALFASIQRADECIIIQGAVPDPSDLNYLRDTVGVVLYFLEHGGVAVLDPQQFKLFDAERWRKELFEPQPPQLHRHVVILVSEETAAPAPPPGGAAGKAETGESALWIHTRGLRKFGRPDLSLRHVPRTQQVAAIDLCNRFIQLQAQGALIAEGQEIRMESLPAGLVCRHGGSVEDPDFNNVHMEIRWPD